MTPVGEVKLYFSEMLRPIDEMNDLNLTVISNNQVFDISYLTNVGADMEENEYGQTDSSTKSSLSQGNEEDEH